MDKIIGQCVIDLYVFDENGKLITKILKSTENSIKYKTENGNSYILSDDITFNEKLIELYGQVITNEYTDFDSMINKNPRKTIRFNKKNPCRQFKLIAIGEIVNNSNEKIENLKIIIPKATLVQSHELNFQNGTVDVQKYKFKILPFNEEGDLFDLQFE